MLEQIAKLTMVVLLGLGALIAVTNVGKVRRPTSSRDAVASIVVNGLAVAAILTWWD